MSTTIDEKVVEMRFDNQQFEKNVSTTMSTLESLKKSLNFSNAAKSMDSLSSAAKSCDFSPLSSAVSSIQAKFSALDVIAVAALTNITNSAVNAGKRLVESLSVDQIAAGWDKYAEKTSSVQTIMAATAKDFSDVNAQMEYVNQQLGKLNWYTDETSYNLLDMVSNIGKFTSNRIPLNTSVTAMQGIANWAAISGANAGEASRAMYNLSQAIAVGAVKLIDWKSIENANMSTAEFKETAIETAVALGTLTKKADGTFQTLKGNEVSVSNFNAALSDSWFSSEVLLGTLDKYGAFTDKLYEATESTGLSATELLQGIEKFQNGALDVTRLAADTGVTAEELSRIFNELGSDEMAFGLKALKAAQEAKTFADAINATKDAVSTGWMNTFEIIFGDYTQAKTLWTNLSNDLWEIFASGGERRNDLFKSALGGNLAWEEISRRVKETGIDVEQFQKRCIELGKEYGHVTDEMIDAAGGFEQSLSSGWLSRNIVSTVLKGFADSGKEASAAAAEVTMKIEDLDSVVKQILGGGFGNGAERVEALAAAGYDYATVQTLVNKALGDNTVVAGANLDNLVNTAAAVEELSDAELENLGFTEEQVSAIRSLSDEARKAGSSLSELIDNLDKPTGRELLIGGLSNVLHGLMGAMQAVREGWSEIFPPATALQVYRLVEKFNELTQSLILVDEETGKLNETGGKLKRTFKGLFAALDIIRMAVGGPVTLVFEVFKSLLGALDLDILDFTAGIGDAIVSFRDWVKANDHIGNAMRKLAGWITDGIKAVKEWVDSFLALDEVQFVLGSLSDIFRSFKGDLADYFQGGNDAIGAFIARCRNLDGVSFKNIGAAISDFWKNVVLGYFFKFNGKFENLRKTLETFQNKVLAYFRRLNPEMTVFFEEGWARIQEFIAGLKQMDGFSWKNIKQGIKDFKKKVLDYFLNIDALLEKVGNAFTKLGQKIREFFTGSGKLGDRFRNTFGSVLETLFGADWRKKFKMVSELFSWLKKMIGSGIGWITETLKGFDLGDLLWTAVGVGTLHTVYKVLRAPGLIVDFLAGFSTSIGDISTGLKRMFTGAAILEVAIAIVVLAKAIAVLAKLDPAALRNALDALQVLAFIIVALMGVMSQVQKLSPMGAEKLVFSMVGVAAAIFLLTEAFIQLDKIEFRHPGYTFAALTIMTLGLILALQALGKVSKISSPWQVLGVVAIAAALWILVSAFKRLDAIEFNHFGKTLSALIILCIGLGVVGAMLKKTSFGSAAGVIAIAVALWLLVGVIEKLDKLELDNPDRVVFGMIGLIVAILLLMLTVRAAGKNAGNAGFSILGIAAGMLLMIEVIKQVSDISVGEILKGLFVIGALTGFIGTLMLFSKFTEKAQPVKTGLMILMIAGAMLLLVAAIKLLSKLSWNELAKGTTPLLVLGAVFAGLMYVSQYAKKCISGIVLIVLTIALITIAVLRLSRIEPERLWPAMAAISIIAAVMAALVGVSGLVKPSWQSMLLIVVVLGAIAGALYLLCTYTNVDDAIGIAKSLSVLIVALSVAMAACALVGMVGPGAFIGVGVLATVLVVFIVVIGIITLIGETLKTYSIDLHALLDEYLPLLGDIGYAIGDFLGSIIGGFSAGLSSGLPEIGENLADFGEAIAGVPDGVADKAGQIALALAAFGTADFLNNVLNPIAALHQWRTGESKFSGVGDDLEALGKAMVQFSESISGLSDKDLARSTDTLSALSDFTSTLQRGKGIGTIFTGKTGLASFAEEMGVFGEKLVAFANNVSDLDDTDSQNIGRALLIAGSLSNFAKTLETGKGIWQKISGATGLGLFAGEMGKFGENAKSLVENVSGLDDTDIADIETAIKIATLLSDYSQTLVIGEGWWQKLTGKTGLGAFAEELGTFGKKVKSLTENVKDISYTDMANISRAVYVGKELADFANEIPEPKEDSSWWQKLTGKTGLGAFAKEMGTFGSNVKDLGEKLNVDEGIAGKMQSAIDCGMLLIGFSDSLGSFDGNDSLAAFSETLTDYGDAIYCFCQNLGLADMDSLETFASSFSAIGEVMSSGALTGIANASEQFRKAGGDMAEQLMSGFEGRSDVFDAAVSTLLTTMTTAVSKGGESMVKASSEMSGKLAYGLRRGTPAAANGARTLVNAAVSVLRGKTNTFYQAGQNFAYGVGNGIADTTWYAEMKARYLASRTVEATRKAFDEHSPSKIGYRIGEFFAMPIAGALYDWSDRVGEAGANLGNAAVQGVSNAISAVAEAVSSDMDTTPVIRPVLDLSEVRSQAGTIGALLNRDQALSISSGMNAPAEENQNGQPQPASFSFTQNNYSPKALSSIDIYRQTKNQFSALKGAVVRK
jgi:hypothetical protein